MVEKLTLRDLIIFFVSGFLFITVFFTTFYDIFYDWLIWQISDNEIFERLDTTIIIASGIPFLYIVGHFVHAIDSLVFHYLGRPIYDLKKKMPNMFFNFLNNILNYHRIIGLKDRHWSVMEEVPIVDTKCSVQPNLYSEAMYWRFLNDTFKAYVLIFGIFTCIAFVRGFFLLGSIYLLFVIIFRTRGRLFGRYYLDNLSRIYQHIILAKS